MGKRSILTLVGTFLVVIVSAQTDKHDADSLIWEELVANYEIENWHPDLIVTKDMLNETQEKGIFLVLGKHFQVKSIRSDFYVREENGRWTPLNDARYPLETMTNLLLNRINDNKHQIELRHHQYGGKKARMLIPMQKLYDLLARNMDLYCSVTYIDKFEIRAVLVFHQKRMDFIHMVEMKVPTGKLAEPESVMTGELYTNIPQSNLNSLFREKKK